MVSSAILMGQQWMEKAITTFKYFLVTKWGTHKEGSEDGGLYDSYGVAVDGKGNMIVTIENMCIKVFGHKKSIIVDRQQLRPPKKKKRREENGERFSS